MLSSRLRPLALALFLLIAPGRPLPRAHACGGLWCSSDAPVNQAAERIVFVEHEDDRISAVIEIQYRGPSSKFAWLIPIPGKPEISVASTRALDRLDGVTKPSYELERVIEGKCKPGDDFDAHSQVDAGEAASEDAGDDAPPAIRIVDEGSVGPYDYVTIDVDPSLSAPADAAIAWFGDNGYDLTGVDAKVLGPYLADGLHLLAFKLTKAAQQMEGAIRPVILTYDGQAPMIPIRPTAVAAERDMGVLVWVVADARAVPENYKSLILNEALIDWFNPRGTYRAVVTRAADEAGGQGFATELAGPSAAAAEVVFTADEANRLAGIERDVYDDGIDALWAASFAFRDWEGFRDAVETSVELPDGVSLDQFASDPNGYRGSAQVDTQAFFAALHAKVVDPVVDVQKLIASQPYLTRLFTTMSSDEMTTDPVFTFNPDLPNFPNRHVAKQFIECSAGVTEYEAPWRIQLPQGDVVHGAGREWPVDASMVPASRAIWQLSNAGQGSVLVDNTRKIQDALEQLPTPGTRGGGNRQEATPVRAPDEGCSIFAPGRTGFGSLGPASALALLALVSLRGSRGRPRNQPLTGTRPRASRNRYASFAD